MNEYRDPEREGAGLHGETPKFDTSSGMGGAPDTGSFTDTVDETIPETTPPPKLRGANFFFARIFPLIFVAVGGTVAFLGIRGLIRAKESSAWPKTQGRIVESGVRSSHSSKGGTTYHADIRYEYTVDGTVHSGTRVAYGDYGSSNSSHARGIANKYPVGKKVEVSYMPSNPDESLLEPGVKMQAFALPAFGLVFLSFGLLAAFFLPGSIRKSLAKKA